MTETPKTPPRVKYTIQAVMDEFPVAIELEGSADQLKGIINRLRELGATPPTREARAAAAAERAQAAPAGGTWPGGDPRGVYIPEERIPRCPDHGKMWPSEHGGFYCPARDPKTGRFCSYQADGQEGLSPGEQHTLREMEIISQRAIERLRDALRIIEARKLYRGTHPTLKSYCIGRWGMSEETFDQIINGYVSI